MNNAPDRQRVERIKVLQLVEWFDRGGGLEQVVAEIATGLDRRYFDVEIWCIARAGALVEEYRRRGVTVRVLNLPTYHNPANIWKLAQMLRRYKPDIIHSHIYFAGTIGRLAGLLAGVPVMIHHVHSSYTHFSLVNRLVERCLSCVTFKVLCVSQCVKRFVREQQKISAKKLHVIYNGITQQNLAFDRRSLRASLHIEADDMVVISVASLLENKGHRVILQALSLLKDRPVKVRCLFVGDGPLFSMLRDEIERLDLKGHVQLLGKRTDVAALLSSSDLFVLASLEREGLPISLLEAFAYGVPVIATRVGGVPEVVDHGQNGYLVESKDPAALAEALSKLATDAEARTRFKQAASATFAQKFKAAIMIQQIEACYRQALNSKRI